MKITVFNALPYPDTKAKINKEDYCLKIKVN